MVKGSGRFMASWLERTDRNGHLIKEWCKKSHRSETTVYCTLCKKAFDLGNGGLGQLLKHADGFRHIRNTASLSKEPSAVSTKVSQEQVTKAECLWALTVAYHDYPYSSCDGLSRTFKEMFPDNSVANELRLDSLKVDFAVTHGLAPYFQAQLLSELREAGPFALTYSERRIDRQQTQLDMNLVFWGEKVKLVQKRYYQSRLLQAPVSSVMIRDAVDDALAASQLDMRNLLTFSLEDGIVPKALWKMMDDKCRQSGSLGLVDAGTFTPQIVHSAFGVAMRKMEKWHIDDLLDDLFRWFQQSTARRDDYPHLNKLLQFEQQVYGRYSCAQWLDIAPVIDAVINQWKHLHHYFKEQLPKTHSRICQSSDRYSRIANSFHQLTLLRLYFLQHICSPLLDFFNMPDTPGPNVHMLHFNLTVRLRKLLVMFIRPDLLAEKEEDGVDLSNIDVTRTLNMLPDEKLDLGETTQASLKAYKLKDVDRKAFFFDVRKFFETLAKCLIDRLPLDNILLKRLHFLHPPARDREGSLTSLQIVAKKLPNVIPDREIDELVEEWNLLRRENAIKEDWYIDNGEGTSSGMLSWKGVDAYWGRVLAIVKPDDQLKYPILSKVVKAALILSLNETDENLHSCKDRDGLTTYQSNVGVNSINPMRIVKDGVRFNGKRPNRVPITNTMLSHIQTAQTKYLEEMEIRKAEELKQRKAREEAEARAVAAKHGMKSKTEVELRKRKGALSKELKGAESLIKEANQRLKVAISQKDMTEISAAQGVLQTGELELSLCRREISKIEKQLSNLHQTRLPKLPEVAEVTEPVERTEEKRLSPEEHPES